MIPILYQDDDLIAVDKPAGLLSVPGRGPEKADSVQTRIAAQFAGAIAIHRLDMETSGLMLLARHKASERYYKTLFEQRQVRKVYQAVCYGILREESGEIDLPLIGDWPNRPRQKVCFERGKHALTRYRILAHTAHTTRVALYPYTGRSHQLRVHLATVGHPICGDRLYVFPEDHQYPRLLLHACKLSFTTRQGTPLTLRSNMPF